jgi:putative heme-binding domain-containing protein
VIVSVRRKLIVAALAALFSIPAVAAPDPFAENVRPTSALTPEQELKSFTLPPGFTIQLVASEPDIHKPINIAVDDKGRLWTSSTVEYPLVAKADADKGRDEVKIIEVDTATGHAKKITTFADGLNIPTGVYPYKNGVITFSIPYIYYLEDTDGDGKADKRTVLYGPFDTSRDTHGMTNSYIRGYNGWVYGTHGFNNHTTLKGSDGSSIYMESGNIFRMALDGSHVDLIAHGPVNPFGLMFDTSGQLFVADCHTKPFQIVLRGAWFEHFGRPNDGIGFYPNIMGHLHGSTAIGGVVTIDDDRWPEEFRGNLICGNPVTSRVDRDSLVYTGSTPAAKEKPDFVKSTDPWFRPVAFALSPDGSIYMADFYNKIIGHYEVPLTHPGRDHTSGRIWRIVPPPRTEAAVKQYPSDLSTASVDELIGELAHPNITARMLAMDQLSDRIGKDAIEPCRAILKSGTPTQKLHAMWVLFRLKALQSDEILTATKDPERLVRVHAQRVLTELPTLSPEERQAALAGMKDADALVRRCAANALAEHPSFDNVRPLLDLITSTQPADTHLIYAARISLRRQLEAPDVLSKLPLDPWSEADANVVTGVLPAIPTPEAGTYLLKQLTTGRIAANSPNLGDVLKQISRLAGDTGSQAAVTFVKEKFEGNGEHQLNLLKSIQEGTAQRGGKLDDATRAWATDVITRVLKEKTRNPAQRIQTISELAKALSLKECAAPLAAVMNDPKADGAARAAAIKTVLALDPANVPAVAALVADAGQSTAIREAAAKALSEANTDEARKALLMPIRVAPQAIATKLAVALASRPDGANTLMEAFEHNTLLPRLLLEPTLKDKLAAAKIKDLDKRIATLTKNLAPASAQLDKLIASKRAAFKPGDVEKGKAVFTKTCAICHQIEGQGAVVGPQLDGVGARGLDRILEDVVDPNRNVDPMFRFTNITLKDGDTISGLVRAEVGQTVTLVDPTGKENAVPKADIDTREVSKLSLMPTGFGEIIPAGDFNDLLTFLLSKREAKKQ